MKTNLNRKVLNGLGQASALLIMATMVACGQNPALTRAKDPSSAGGQQTAQKPEAPIESDGSAAPEVDAVSGAGGSPSQGEGTDVADGSKPGENSGGGSNGQNGGTPVADGGNSNATEPSPDTIAIPAPLNPPVSQPPLYVSTCPKEADCVKTFSKRFPILPLSKAELDLMDDVLPYKDTDKKDGVKGRVFKKINFGRTRYAQYNTQILMKVEIDELPPRLAVTGLEATLLSMDLGVRGHGRTLNNQLFCFMEAPKEGVDGSRICSGEMINTGVGGDRTYLDNFNPKFFAGRGGPVNRYYSSQPLDDKVNGDRHGKGNIKLDLGMLVAGTEYDALEVLYGIGADGSKWVSPSKKRTLYFLAAEDTIVRNNNRAYLLVTLNYDGSYAAQMDKPPVIEAPKSRRRK